MKSGKSVASVCGAILLAHAGGMAHALPPDQLFERVAPGVWSVKAYGAEGRLLASASAVAVAPGKVVTSCRVLARAHRVQLQYGDSRYEAELEFPDVERDLCQLDVPNLSAPAPVLGTARGLRTGQRLYVVGFSRGNEQSLGEGLVSVVVAPGTERERIQTTVPASVGLLGAGLFDTEGHLVGIVTGSPEDAAAHAFAVPADWLADLAARGEAALIAHAKRAASGSGTAGAQYPAPGTVWTYRFTDRIFSRRSADVNVRVLRVEGTRIEELISGASGGTNVQRDINAPELRFFVHALDAATATVELAPYLLASTAGKPPAELSSPEGYPRGSPGLPSWLTSMPTVEGWDKVEVPAGSYRALRLDVAGRRSADPGIRTAVAKSFSMSIWYAPDVRRIVRIEHRAWTTEGYAQRLISDEVLELVSYRPPS